MAAKRHATVFRGFDAAILTCEHGGAQIPREYKHLFVGWQGRLKTHFGYDKGALPVAQHLAKVMGWPLHAALISRLLIDLNRPLDDETIFSKRTAALSLPEQQRIVARYYQPYWQKVEDWVREHQRRRETLLHLSIHSFTPVRLGVRRDCDLGLLYDPRSDFEHQFCLAWRRALDAAGDGRYRIRMNYPYRGDSPALTTSLRQKFSGPKHMPYAGVELEINQKFARQPEALRAVMKVVAKSLEGFVGACTR